MWGMGDTFHASCCFWVCIILCSGYTPAVGWTLPISSHWVNIFHFFTIKDFFHVVFKFPLSSIFEICLCRSKGFKVAVEVNPIFPATPQISCHFLGISSEFILRSCARHSFLKLFLFQLAKNGDFPFWRLFSKSPRELSRDLLDQNYFYQNGQALFVFLLVLSQVYRRAFQQLHNIWHDKRLKTETEPSYLLWSQLWN